MFPPVAFLSYPWIFNTQRVSIPVVLSIIALPSNEKAFRLLEYKTIGVDDLLIFCFSSQALSLQDSDDEAKAEEKAVEEVS